MLFGMVQEQFIFHLHEAFHGDIKFKTYVVLLFSEEECGHIVLHTYLELTVHLVKSPFLKSFE